MSTEWNNKLALALRDAADPAYEILPTASLRGALVATDPEAAPNAAEARHTWLTSAPDRGPASLLAQVTSTWTETGEVTHPLTAERRTFGTLDPSVLREKATALAAEAAKRFDDSRRRWLWVWRYFADRLASEVGAAAHMLPADPRMPDLSVWSRISLDGALATATPSPVFFVAHLEPSIFDTATPPPDRALLPSLSLRSHLAWEMALAVIEQLGPDAVLSPSLRHHPRCDEWLAGQKVTAKKGDKVAASPAFASFPSSFVALVPQARAAEVGDACKARLRTAWEAVAAAGLEKLKASGVSVKDKTFAAVWERQVAGAWQGGWVGVPWLDDSTGAGGLLGKADVSAHEKWAKLHQDASGLEDPWPGVYFGLWYLGALAASDARRQRMSTARVVEPGPRCTSCGQHEALHEGAAADRETAARELWGKVRGSAAGAEIVAEGEMLCACCVSARAWAAAPPRAESDAVVVFGLDQAAAIRRGGKELKQGATVADLLHSAGSDAAGKARGATKELLESISVLGPARLTAFEGAAQTLALHTIPRLVADAGGTMLYADSDEQIAIVASDRALELVKKVREASRQGFVEVSGRTAIQPGASAMVSAAVVAGTAGSRLSHMTRVARSLVQGLGRDSLGGDALVLAMVGSDGERQVLGLKGQEIEATLGSLVASFPSAARWQSLAAALRGIRPALVNADIDKVSPDGRAVLIRDALGRAGIAVNGGANEDDTARALCVLIDKAVAQAEGEAQRAMDGLEVAARFAGGNQ